MERVSSVSNVPAGRDNPHTQGGASSLTTHLQGVNNTAGNAGLSPLSGTMLAAWAPAPPARAQTRFPVAALLEHVKELVPEAMLQHPEQMAESILVETVGLLTRGEGALLSSVLDPQKVHELVKAVSKIADEKMKAKAIVCFASTMRYLSNEARADLLLATKDIKHIEQELGLLCAFANAIKYLNQEERALILTMVTNVSNEGDRATLLLNANLAQLTAAECDQIVKVVLAIENEEARALVLGKLFSQLSRLRPESKSAVIEAATRIKPALLSEVLIRLQVKGNNLNDKDCDSLLTAAAEIPDKTSRTRVLASLAAELTCLKPELRQNLIAEALAIADEKERFKTIDCLMGKVETLDLAQVRQLLFNEAYKIENENLRSSALGVMADQAVYLDKVQHQGLMSLTKRMRSETNRSKVLFFLIRQSKSTCLDKELLREIVEEWFSIKGEEPKIRVLEALGSTLKNVPEDLQRKIIKTALGIANEAPQTTALLSLATCADCMNKDEGELFLQIVTALSGKHTQAMLFATALTAINRAA